ncbi:2-hydroxychromene-2-carboxylate isomerase [Arenimonas sp.]|uniref:2-hydroxychromene-2-carboxylate isomerase n=1 Tax=Arenimonas sp. TaxID=1872635 RepID=UPI0039E5722F
MNAYDWYFDFISPFAYLQWRRLRRDHPQLRLTPKPLLFAGLLNHWGQLGPAEIPGKREHTYRIVLWQARELGIPLRFPPAHPFNPLPALRLCVAAGADDRAVNTIFRHLWEDGLAGDSIEALADVAAELGIPDMAAAVARDEVKRQLAINGAEAIALGVYGVPTLNIDGRLFWGNDATGMALQYLDDPIGFDDDEMRRIESLPEAVQRRRSGA